MSQTEQSLLSFMIGPVQTFIESARTLRDLWSGSYLLSWLTAAAMRPIIQESGCGYEAFVTPHVDSSNPLLAAQRGANSGLDIVTLPSLPNTFAAQVPTTKAEALRDSCRHAVVDEWKAICREVHATLQRAHEQQGLMKGWDRDWPGQLADFFEVRCVIRAISADGTVWGDDWKQTGALMAMARSVRHVPDYEPQADDGRFPAKCSLLGTLEQMGPAGLRESALYWEKLQLPKWRGLHGTKLQSSDRLCAVSLVKRFAWPAYFAKTPDGPGRLGVPSSELRFSDTATIAAALWLEDGVKLTPYDAQQRNWVIPRWSGQWLHAREPESADDDSCDPNTWKRIQAKKAAQGRPPTYYALLHMDGDNMGRLFEGAGPAGWGQGRDRCRNITKRLTHFSLNLVDGIVQDHAGELIYAGGDDVLAILPTAKAIRCALALRSAFGGNDVLGEDASASAGIAVVHYKDDLRFALNVARQAEKAAKNISGHAPRSSMEAPRKDALAITLCRHSGEHSTCVMGWRQSKGLIGIVDQYRGDDAPSDRWAYKLRDELPVLQGVSDKAVHVELRRLLKRTESAGGGFQDLVNGLYEGYRTEMDERGWTKAETLDGFTTICQTASFLARGSE